MDNQNTVIALLFVIIALLAVLAIMFSPLVAKDASNLTIDDKEINAGDSLVVKLSDVNGNPISNETINIKLTDKEGMTIDEKATTNSKGNANLKIEETGNYSASCSYDGGDKYSSCSISENIKVDNPKTEVVETHQSSSDSKSSSDTLYDINNLPPTNDPYPETNRYFIDEYTVKQEYADGYMRAVDIRTGKIYSLGFR